MRRVVKAGSDWVQTIESYLDKPSVPIQVKRTLSFGNKAMPKITKAQSTNLSKNYVKNHVKMSCKKNHVKRTPKVVLLMKTKSLILINFQVLACCVLHYRYKWQGQISQTLTLSFWHGCQFITIDEVDHHLTGRGLTAGQGF